MAGAREDNSELRFTASVRGFHVYRRVWLPHFGQRLSAEREQRNAEDCFVITVREHTDTRADDDVDDRPVVGHLPRELTSSSYTQTRHKAFYLTPSNRINNYF